MIYAEYDMPMPKSCEACPFLVHCDACESWENYCALTFKKNGYDKGSYVKEEDRTPYNSRRDDCPLKEVEE